MSKTKWKIFLVNNCFMYFSLFSNFYIYMQFLFWPPSQTLYCPGRAVLKRGAMLLVLSAFFFSYVRVRVSWDGSYFYHLWELQIIYLQNFVGGVGFSKFLPVLASRCIALTREEHIKTASARQNNSTISQPFLNEWVSIIRDVE